MARTLIPTQTIADAGADTISELALAGANAVDGNSFRWSKDTVLMIYNPDDQNDYSVTITGVADKDTGRNANTVLSVPSLALVKFGPAQASGWRQPDGTVHFSAANAALLLFVIRIRPATS